MLKWIKNSKGSRANKTTNYRGIRFTVDNRYVATLVLTKYNREGKRKQEIYTIGSFGTEKEAVKARVDYILEML